MDRRNFFRMCTNFEDAIASYSGNDPLQNRYEYIKWLAENNGKENASDYYFRVLGETVNMFQQDPRYLQDVRFLTIIMHRMEMEDNKTQFLRCIYDHKIGTQLSQLYLSWSGEHLKKGEFSEALSVVEMGITNNAQPSEVIKATQEKIYAEAGKAWLSGNISCEHSSVKCKECAQKRKSDWDSPLEVVRNWPCLPLKPGQEDCFSCAMVVPDPDDPSKVPMYPKSEVYVNNQEFQLEEVFSKWYFQKKKRMDIPKTPSVPQVLKNSVPVTPRQPLVEIPAEEECTASCAGAACPVTPGPSDENAPPVDPLAMNPALHIPFPNAAEMSSAQSFTVNTKIALDMVHEMWKSPSGDKLVKRPESPEPVPVSTIPQPIPFSVFSDNSVLLQQENVGQTRESTVRKSLAKGGLSERVVEPAARQRLVIPEDSENPCPSEFKTMSKSEQILTDIGTSGIKSLSKAEPAAAKVGLTPRVSQPVPLEHHAKHKLILPGEENPATPLVSAPISDDALACRLDPVPNIPPICPSSDEWNEDTTCDTKVFYNFISTKNISTPNFKGNPQLDAVTESTKKLSVINEVSKEPSTSSASASVSSDKSSCVSGFLIPYENVNPHSTELRNLILNRSNFPVGYYNCFVSQSPMPTLNQRTQLGTKMYSITQGLSQGSYRKVVKAVCHDRVCALKLVKPCLLWECYIIKQIHQRLNPGLLAQNFINANFLYAFKNGSILEIEYAPLGSLTNCVNMYKKSTGSLMNLEITAIIFKELLLIIEHLHLCRIIHCNFNSDNILVRSPNNFGSKAPFLQLIGFSRSIDMSVLPANTTFTSSLPAFEMIDNKPWSYQVDFYGLAGVIYFITKHESFQAVKKRNKWCLMKPYFRNNGVWNNVMDMLLNIDSVDTLPSCTVMKKMMDEVLAACTPDSIQANVYKFVNFLKSAVSD